MGEEVHKDTLDLSDAGLDALFARVGAMAAGEIRATRSGPVFDPPLSAPQVEELVDGAGPLPLDGEPLEDLLERCRAVLDGGRRTAPAFFGYVFSPAAPIAVAADLLTSAADQNVTSWRSAPAATQVERTTIRWLGEFVGFATDAAGLLVGGGSMANLTALLVALRSQSEPDADRRELVAYASQEAHFSIEKAAAAIGVGFRRVPVGAGRRLDVEALRRAIAADRRAAKQPFCVVATAGTTATGAVDPLDAIADLAEAEQLWLHVDGAYGAPAAADPASRPLFAGLERAESLCVDAHKWLYVPVDCGALLMRSHDAGPKAFGAADAAYVRILTEEAAESFAFWDHGLELSRRFRALKLWMTLRYCGARRLSAAITHDIAMAEHMAAHVRESPELELLAEPGLSICCFRHAPPGMADAALDQHNERLLTALHRDGRSYLSNAVVDGRFALRACITNFRTTGDEVERTLALVCELGDRVAAPRG